MISSLYLESGFTINDMAKMLNRKRRTIFRYIKILQNFAPIILTYYDYSDNKFHLKLVDKISNSVDVAFNHRKKIPLIYVFISSLCQEIRIADIRIMFGCSTKEAKNIRNSIFDTTHLGTIEYEECEL